MKSRVLYLNVAAILCLTSCVQKAKELSTSPSSPAVSSTNSKTILATTNNTIVKKPTGEIDNSQLLSDLGQKLFIHKLDKLSNDTIICTVNNVPITIGDYRREFKVDQQEVQASLTYNADLANQLLQAASKQHITLSPKEQQILLKSTGKMQIGGKKSFDKMLANSHMTKKQFDDQVISMGLACKTANIMVEHNLLNELVNRLLLAQAAKDDGFSKAAMSKYAEVSKSEDYKEMMATGAFSAEDLRNEIINNELGIKETDKIKNAAPLTDIELNDFYEKNRGKFRHGTRLRLSQIFIAPAEPTPSPKDKKYQLAQSYLERAQQGEDFATLADQYSQDPSKSKKDGGDLGLQDESQLSKDFAAKVVKLAPGTVVPEIIISPHGYHIFKITSIENPGFYRLDDVKDKLKGALSQQKDKQTINEWLVNQRQKATIVVAPQLQNLLANNKLATREDVGINKQGYPRTQISGRGQHF